ncbi:MAG: hypothetical protein ABFD75_12510 [Smithella sp.]
MKINNKILVIVGSAPCVGDDLSALSSIYQGMLPMYSYGNDRTACDVMLIGFDSVDKCLFPAKYFATYHPSEIVMSKERRAKEGGNTNWTIISHQQHEGLVNIIIPLVGVPSGSSALLGVHAGIQEGYKKIVVCGCPLTGSNDKGNSYEIFRKGWEAKINEIKDYVRSMSGWTRDFVGAPTAEWLNT